MTFPGYHGQRNVPRTGVSLRHRVRRQSAGTGDVQTFQGTHGGGQTSTQVPGRDNELCNHLQARGFQANGVLRRKLG